MRQINAGTRISQCAGLDIDNSGFAGYGYDQVIGMYFAQYRLYDANNKRFTAVDPVAGNVLEPQSLNPYLYVRNNPANAVDPWGLSEVQLRKEIEAMGGTITYNESTKTATAIVNGRELNVTNGVNGNIATSGSNKDHFVVDSKLLDSLKSAAVAPSVAAAAQAGGFNFPPNYGSVD
jgi:RHS repeat-associated protein